MSREGKILAIAGFLLVAAAVALSLRSSDSITQTSTAPSKPTRSSVQPRTQETQVAWREAEKGVPYLHAKDVSWFLKRARIPTFETEFNQARGIGATGSDAELKSIAWAEGCYRGTVQLEDGRKWGMSTDISIAESSMDVTLSEKGATFLNAMAGDGLRDLKRPARGSVALLLEASENIFFQLYPVRETGSIVGNAYLRSDRGELVFGGTAVLMKTECASQ